MKDMKLGQAAALFALNASNTPIISHAEGKKEKGNVESKLMFHLNIHCDTFSSPRK
jgi:hypothetical protein